MEDGIEKEPGLRDLRCCCGSLVARVIESQIEIKCRRCKRIHRIPVEAHAPAMPAGIAGKRPAAPLGGKFSGPSERRGGKGDGGKS